MRRTRADLPRARSRARRRAGWRRRLSLTRPRRRRRRRWTACSTSCARLRWRCLARRGRAARRAGCRWRPGTAAAKAARPPRRWAAAAAARAADRRERRRRRRPAARSAAPRRSAPPPTRAAPGACAPRCGAASPCGVAWPHAHFWRSVVERSTRTPSCRRRAGSLTSPGTRAAPPALPPRLCVQHARADEVHMPGAAPRRFCHRCHKLQARARGPAFRRAHRSSLFIFAFCC
jgi:hypothetical protein